MVKEHIHRVSGMSGRTAGKMLRKSKARPSSERRGLRAKNQLKPMGRNRYPAGCKMRYQDGSPVPGC